jgi:hypothetical protein
MVAAPIATPGEQMIYRISLHGFEVGEYTITVGDIAKVGDADAVVVQSSARTSRIAALLRPVQDEFASWIDRSTGRSLLFTSRETDARGAQIQEQTEARFDGERIAIRVIRPNGEHSEVQTTRDAAYDMTSFLIFLRGWDADVGTRLEADVMRSRYVWRLQVIATGFENLDTELGSLEVARFDGESVRTLRDGTIDPASDRRQWSIWISDDADRVPIKIVARTDYGAVTMEIVSYRPGTTTTH